MKDFFLIILVFFSSSIFKNLGVISFILLLNLNTSSQTISSSQFLEKAISDPRLDYHEKKMDYLKNTSHELPVTESLEFRTETDEFDIRRQEYMFRMDFNTKRERKAQRAFHQSTILATDLEKDLIIKDNLEDNYQIWTNYYFYQKEIDFRKEELLVLEDKFKVAGILAKTTGKYDLGDLIRIEDDIDDIKSDIHQLETQMGYVKKIIGDVIEDSESATLDFSNFISLEKINTVLNTLPNEIVTDPDMDILQASIMKDNAEINLEKAQGQKLLDFVQMKYSGRGENTPYGREWSFGLGINIPIKNSDILDIKELELSKLESEESIERIRLRAKERILDRKRKIEMLFEQYDLLVQQLAENEKNYSLEHYAKTGTDPLVLLQIKESQLRRKRAILNVEEDIYMMYLDLMDLTGKMIEQPFVNYLSEGLDNF